MAKDPDGGGSKYNFRGDAAFDEAVEKAKGLYKTKKASEAFRNAVNDAIAMSEIGKRYSLKSIIDVGLTHLISFPLREDLTDFIAGAALLGLSVPDLKTWARLYGHMDALCERARQNKPTVIVMSKANFLPQLKADNMDIVLQIFERIKDAIAEFEPLKFYACTVDTPVLDFIVQSEKQTIFSPYSLWPNFAFIFRATPLEEPGLHNALVHHFDRVLKPGNIPDWLEPYLHQRNEPTPST